MAAARTSSMAPYGASELQGLAASAVTAPVETADGRKRLEAEAAAATERRLWERFVTDRDEETREALIMLHLPYARVVAAGVFSKHSYHETEFAEYVQLATLGLIEALDRFELDRGAQFRSYAHWRMVGAIHDGLAHVSERQEQITLHRKLSAERLAAAKGRRLEQQDLTDAELLRDVADIGAGLMLSFMLEGTQMIEADQQALPDGYDSLVFKEEQRMLHTLIERLTPREQSVIRLHYLQGLTYEYIAGSLGITKGRVSQLHEQALNRLRSLITGANSSALK